MTDTVQHAAALGVSLVGAAYFLGGTTDQRGIVAAIALLGFSVQTTGVLFTVSVLPVPSVASRRNATGVFHAA